MTLLRIDPGSSLPPYEQVRTQVAALVSTGELAAGQKLPTVRQLAAELDLAPNTVARAYRELEGDGVITTQGRRGTFVRSCVLDSFPGRGRRIDAEDAAATLTAVARSIGLTLAETTRLVEGAWSPRGRA